MPSGNFVDVFVAVFLSLCGLMGLLALLSPRWFSRIATYTGQWIDSAKALAAFDKRVDIDQYALRHSRILGTLVVVSVSLLGYLYLGK